MSDYFFTLINKSLLKVTREANDGSIAVYPIRLVKGAPTFCYCPGGAQGRQCKHLSMASKWLALRSKYRHPNIILVKDQWTTRSDNLLRPGRIICNHQGPQGPSLKELLTLSLSDLDRKE